MPFVALLHGINVHVAFSRASGIGGMASCQCRVEGLSVDSSRAPPRPWRNQKPYRQCFPPRLRWLARRCAAARGPDQRPSPHAPFSII